jgi:hypothetical protein
MGVSNYMSDMKSFRSVVNCQLSIINYIRYLFLLVACFLFSYIPVSAQIQVSPDRYRIEFTDKNSNAYSVAMPGFFLSERALARRIRQGIPVTHEDLPVSACYIDSLKKMDIEVLNTSRWFNSAIIRCSPEDIEKLGNIDFIKKTSALKQEAVEDTSSRKSDLERLFSFLFQEKKTETDISLYTAPKEYYGRAADQIGMLNGHNLHDRGFRGKGMLVAVIDGGFHKVDELSGFDSMRHDGRFRGVKNFSADGGVFGENNHGANVLSILAANMPGRMMGSAPDAEYILLRSEENGKEYLVEEDNWVAAAEYADSIGVDIITSSLGYSTFDDKSQNHRYENLDGKSIRVSYAAAKAAARGMIVCVSAGNDGDMPWQFVSAPGDADSVLTVGAVDRYREHAPFSSLGPTPDGRIKPDIVAMGKDAAYQSSTGTVNTGSGTSYSTPVIAGLMACLWQAYPEKGNMEIIEMVKQSADRYHEPDSLYGYGIPDFARLVPDMPANNAENIPFQLVVFPNPFTGTFTLYLSPARHGFTCIRIYTIYGQEIYHHKKYIPEYNAYELHIPESAHFSPGMYLIKAYSEAGQATTKAVKQ